MKGVLEEDLREPVAQYLSKLGFGVHHEVPILGRIADLLGVRAGEAVAVELKLALWRTAIGQARAYQLAAREVYVAMPRPAALRLEEHREAFDVEGVGLLAVELPSGHVKPLWSARPSGRLLPFLTEAILRDLQRPIMETGMMPSEFVAAIFALGEG